jgi:hypothetical protein
MNTRSSSSKDVLSNSLGKKFDTTMIFALAEFEECFGYIWGFGKDKSELTEKEISNAALWEEARKNILDNGNHQKRKAKKELERYQISPTQFNYNFKPRNQGNSK